MSKKKVTVTAVVIASSVYLAGCGLWPDNEKKEAIDPPQTVTYLKEGEAPVSENKPVEEGTKDAENQNIAMTELYLIDKNGYVVPQSMPLPNTKSLAKQALEYLVVDGPVTNMIPNGFRAVLPAGTEVLSVDIKDGKAIADFSKEFNEYHKDDEQKIVQAVTWTLTQFDSVENIELRVNGQSLKEMPVNGMALNPEGLTRESGINIDTEDAVDVANTRPLTVYYMAQEEEDFYYVPVTKRVSNAEGDNIMAAVEELVEGPSHSSELVSEFLPDAQLLEEPIVQDGKVTLNFNKSILGSFEDKMISESLLNALVLSLTEQPGIKSVAVKVDGESKLVTEKGKPVSESVTRPENVNTGSF